MSAKIRTSKSAPLIAFTDTSVTEILREAQEALQVIADKHGIKLDRKGRTYTKDALPVMFQFLIKQTDANGNEITAAGRDFLRYAQTLGLQAEDLGREFTNPTGTMRIVGVLPRSRELPILVQDVKTGKQYKFGLDTIKAAIGRERTDAKFRSGRSRRDESFKDWLTSRKGHEFSCYWKEEMVDRGGTLVGPIHVIDETEAKKDPENDGDGIPFGASYCGETEWMTCTEAQKLAAKLGLTIKKES